MRILPASLLLLTLLGPRHGAALPAIDPVLVEKFAALPQTDGFVPGAPTNASTAWAPQLRLWMGVKATEGKKQTVYFVQLTTLPTLTLNEWREPWQPALRTNHWSWHGTNQNVAATRAEYVMPLYPVQVRVFDGAGRALKEGQTTMAWGMLTNGLLDMCRLSLELLPRNPDPNQPQRPLPDAENDQLMRAVGGGFLWMMHMFGDLQTVSSVADVWKQAQCAIRMPGAWTVVKSLFTGFVMEIQPRLREVTRVTVPAAEGAEVYSLPLELRSRGDELSRVEITVGPARGAEMLLAGIRSIRAVHPSKANREFLAQVLAVGACAPAP
jgi:hypothetical protein